MTRPGAELCSPHRDPPLFPQHLPPPGQARGGELHLAEVRSGSRVLRGVRSSSDQDQPNIQDIQVTLYTRQPHDNWRLLISNKIDKVFKRPPGHIDKDSMISYLLLVLLISK